MSGSAGACGPDRGGAQVTGAPECFAQHPFGVGNTLSMTDTAIQNGHGPVMVTPKRVAAQGVETRQRDHCSPAPGWPRLMPLHLAGAYLGVSQCTVREWINAGDLPVVEARRPRTASALKHRPTSEALRRLLVDRTDLDALADTFTKVRR